MTQKKAHLDLVLVNREDLVGKMEIGGCLGHRDGEAIKFKISVYRSARKISALDMRRTDFSLLGELLSKVPLKIILLVPGSISVGHFLITSKGHRSRQFPNTRSQAGEAEGQLG